MTRLEELAVLLADCKRGMEAVEEGDYATAIWEEKVRLNLAAALLEEIIGYNAETAGA